MALVNVSFTVSHATDMLHRSFVQIWDKYLIIFAERVSLAEEITVEGYS
jgi:hypothetical protein